MIGKLKKIMSSVANGILSLDVMEVTSIPIYLGSVKIDQQIVGEPWSSFRVLLLPAVQATMNLKLLEVLFKIEFLAYLYSQLI